MLNLRYFVKLNKNVISYLFEFLTLDEKIEKMKLNKSCFKALNDQQIYAELRILNKELRNYKGVQLGDLLDNNARIFTKIVKSYGLQLKEDLL